MRLFPTLRSGLPIAALCLCAWGQNTPKPAQASDAKGLPARTSASEYQAKAQAGTVTIAADFVGHSVPTGDGTYSTEDYVVVEVGMFGAADARAMLSSGDFSLRINDKKAVASEPFDLVSHSLKDPEWAPPGDKEKSKAGFVGGKEKEPSGAAPHMPMPLQLAMQKRVRSAVMLEGDRTLPQAGLLFFEYRGKDKGIRTVELIYAGAAGKATLPLQP